MKSIFFSLLITHTLNTAAQVEKIPVPNGIVYKYCDSATYEKAKSLVEKELSDSPTYSLNDGIMFIGPVLWSRYKTENSLSKIKGGDMTILGYDKKKPSGKLTQSKEDFKLVWDHLRQEISKGSYKFRKATPPELSYYWSVISFDIDEPLIIIETAKHNYLLNLSPKDLKLVWLDETPRR